MGDTVKEDLKTMPLVFRILTNRINRVFCEVKPVSDIVVFLIRTAVFDSPPGTDSDLKASRVFFTTRKKV
jgi:hypothetical protein